MHRYVPLRLPAGLRGRGEAPMPSADRGAASLSLNQAGRRHRRRLQDEILPSEVRLQERGEPSCRTGPWVVRVGDEVEPALRGRCPRRGSAGTAARRSPRSAKPTESNTSPRSGQRPSGAAPVMTRQSSVTGDVRRDGLDLALDAGLGLELHEDAGPRCRIAGSSSVLPGQSPPIALTCTPGATCHR